MKTRAVLKNNIFFIACTIFFLTFVNVGYAAASNEDAAQGEQADINNAPPPAGNELQKPEYVPGEVIVEFNEDADPQAVLEEAGLPSNSIERVHSIQPVAARFKKDYKISGAGSGWYSFLGKNYEEVNNISDEDAFKEAYKDMEPERKALYLKYKVALPENVSVEDAVAKMKENPGVESAYPNYIREVFVVPNDPRYSEQWPLPLIQAPSAWNITQGRDDVVIAIIDTGVDYNHPDLKNNIWINKGEIAGNGKDDDKNGYVDDVRGYNFVSVPKAAVAPGERPGPRDNNPMDFEGHGTHCAGIAAAVANNSYGIAGVAPKCKIMALRAGFEGTNGIGSLTDADVSAAILYAIDNHANVISMSFGGPVPGSYEKEVKLALSKNVVLVAAAGNTNSPAKCYPAADDGVISVAACDRLGNRASFSTYGSWVTVAAPGISILSTLPNNRFGMYSGTSMACPHVAGVVGLILSVHREYTPSQVKQLLQNTVTVMKSPAGIFRAGFGVVNAAAAVSYYKAIP